MLVSAGHWKGLISMYSYIGSVGNFTRITIVHSKFETQLWCGRCAWLPISYKDQVTVQCFQGQRRLSRPLCLVSWRCNYFGDFLYPDFVAITGGVQRMRHCWTLSEAMGRIRHLNCFVLSGEPVKWVISQRVTRSSDNLTRLLFVPSILCFVFDNRIGEPWQSVDDLGWHT